MERREHLLPPPLSPTPSLAAKHEIRNSNSELPLNSRIKKDKKKRRFNEEQVKLMESMFETETKLEPRKKVQLAKDLGLQPRQVAIWFQNKRARWKSKQIEKGYRILKANYDNLASQFESLEKERQSLLLQLQSVRNLLEQSHHKESNDLAGHSTDGGSENEDTNCEYEVNGSCSERELGDRYNIGLDENKSTSIEYTRQEEVQGLSNMGKTADGSSAFFEFWCRADAFGCSDPSCTHSQWWDI